MQIIDPLKLVAKLLKEKENAMLGVKNAQRHDEYVYAEGKKDALNEIIEWVTVNVEDLKKGE